MAKYQQYEEYKNVQNEWISSVPSDWKVVPLKVLCLNPVKDGPHETPVFIDEGIPFLSVDGIQNNQLVFEGCRYISAQDHEKYSRKCAPAKGDILLGKAASVGKVAYVNTDMDFNVWSPLAVITPKTTSLSKYIYYAFQSTMLQAQCEVYSNSNTQKNLGMNTIDNLHLPFPSYKEAEKIANFLDFETAQIDTLIEKQQALIQLLKEKRQAVISHAVTKGLNPDALMKDLGVEWLGKVPEHWEYLKFDYVVNSVGDIDHYMPKSVDSGVPYLMTGDLKDLVSDIDFDRCKQVDNKSYIQLSRKTKTMKGNLILARYATIGTVSYVDIEKEFLVSYACVTIDPNTEIVLGKYLYWYLKSQAFADAIKRYINSNTQGNVGVDSLKRVKLVVPTLKEQESIITYIEDMTSRFDTLNKKAEQAIQLMQERRTALISAAVTGKIDVRSWSWSK